jgi:hypothetical protein
VRKSFAHVVCSLRGMAMEEERAPEKIEGEREVEWVSSERPRVSSFIAGGLGGKLGVIARPRPFRARELSRAFSRHCCPVEACHGVGPSREEEPRGGFLCRRVGRNMRPKRTRGREVLSARPVKRPKTDGPTRPFGPPR